MAVVTRLSTLVSNYEAQPRVLSSGYLAGGNDTITVGTVGAVSTDSIASVYKFGFVPSGVRVQDIQLMNDATTAGVWKLGVYTNDLQSLNMGGPGYSVQTWNSTTAYVPGNVVQYNNVIYYCTTGNTNSAPPSGNWTTGGSVTAAPGVVPIPNADQIFGTGISTAAANTTWKSVYTPLIGAVGASASNASLRVWELLGMVQDPFYEFLLTATATTAPTANGNITLQYSWVR
jgi:hypothetical protein